MAFSIPIPKLVFPDAALLDLFRNTCSIYRIADVEPVVTDDIEAQDTGQSYVLAASNVACHYEPTPTMTEPGPPGRTQQSNILTADKWHFYASAVLEDGWLIVMTGPATDAAGNANSYLNAVWVVEGNSTLNFSLPGRPANSQWFYARLNFDINASDL